MELASGLLMDLGEHICDNLEAAEEAVGGAILVFGVMKNIPKFATIVCRNIALVAKYVWLGVLPIVQAAYIQWVSLFALYSPFALYRKYFSLLVLFPFIVEMGI